MRTLLTIAAPVLLILAGCDAVYTPQPIGEEPFRLDPAQWQGTWLEGEVVLMTTVLDADGGVLETAWLERGQNGAGIELLKGQVRISGETLYLNVLDEPDETSDGSTTESAAGQTQAVPGESGVARYYWARARLNGPRLTVWWPNVPSFRAAVRDGRIPGTIGEDDDVTLGALQPEHLALIEAPEAGLLDWKEPIVFVRVGD